jgi:murein DD-endopeptidase MepM/ murein hydrolase activator NlpD
VADRSRRERRHLGSESGISAAALLAGRPAGETAPRRTRAAERALATRPLWRRTPVIPAVAATLGVWAIGDGLHLVGNDGRAVASVTTDLSALASNPASGVAGTVSGGSASGGGASGAASSGAVGVGAAGAATSASSSAAAGTASSGTERVSRDRRPLRTTAPATGPTSSASGTALTGTNLQVAVALPARSSLPVVQNGKVVPGTWVRPSAGGESSCFCMRWGVMHEGIDLAGPLGSPIVAVGDGVVVEAGPSAGFGHWIVIRHDNGDLSIYGHMYTVLVSVGEHVTAGQHIADIGADGQSTGPHLHFGVEVGGLNGHYIDPVPWLKDRGISVGPYDPNA